MARRQATSDKTVTDEQPTIGPVTIFDADGRVVRVVPAQQFRGNAPAVAGPTAPNLFRGRRGRPRE
jgi:hypothetical protein